MKNCKWTFLCALALVLASIGRSHAAYVNLDIQHVGEVMTSAGLKNVYRVYAYFTQASDRVVSWGGTSSNPTVIRTLHCFSTPGAPFFQAPRFGGNTAPTQSQINSVPETAWDTFATIGVSVANQGSGQPPFAPDQTMLGAGFPTFIDGNQVIINNSLVFTALNAAQAQAGYAGDGDSQLRVLLMQLTTDPSDFMWDSVIGTLTVSSGGNTVTLLNQNWQYLEGFGACCLPNGQCTHTWVSTCAGFGGTPILGCGALCDSCRPPPCADITGNGVVDVDDLLAVISNWGPCPVPPATCPANVVQTGASLDRVDVDDLLAVIDTWGPCR